eukprot:CAMPEP_0113670212 /NCGR_PEP_ID=MMETSP0038_2-20120614/5009_1 /TAXON_ID=2898 /ORGANISM="Cryptomonas paramecium" /LENGTH=33 /DNA_ID=CAMNT_0000586199 /DNA_START=186 /DNA_END=284 /DNA_ORIENTATION=+ /assembly_acc=CAM_ASM_000170
MIGEGGDNFEEGDEDGARDGEIDDDEQRGDSDD